MGRKKKRRYERKATLKNDDVDKPIKTSSDVLRELLESFRAHKNYLTGVFLAKDEMIYELERKLERKLEEVNENDKE